MKFCDIKGNDALVAALSGMVNSGRIPHAIMLHENDGGGAFAVALAFLQYLFCQQRAEGDSCGECPSCGRVAKMIHPDIHYVVPLTAGNTSASVLPQLRALALENPFFTEEQLCEALGIETKSTVISVMQAKEIMENLALSSLEGGYRCVIIYLPEKFNTEAANRLLKSIEEPAEKTQFLLITHAPEKVLQTIASRCQMLRVVPSGAKAPQNEMYEELFASLMDALCSRDMLATLEVTDAIAALPSRENAKAFCSYASEKVREIFLLQQKMDALVPSATEQQKHWAGTLKKTFPRNALAFFTRARSLVERNVNLQLLFTDLADRLSASI